MSTVKPMVGITFTDAGIEKTMSITRHHSEKSQTDYIVIKPEGDNAEGAYAIWLYAEDLRPIAKALNRYAKELGV